MPDAPNNPHRDELSDLRACFSACLDTSSYGTLVCGQDGTVLAANSRLCELFTLDRDAIIGRPAPDVLSRIGRSFADTGAFSARLNAARAEATASGSVDGRTGAQSLESWLDDALPLKSGKSQVISITCAAIRRDGQVLGDVWSFEDAGEVSRDDALLHTLGEASATAYVITRVSDATILYANEEMGRLLGCPPSELIGGQSYPFYDNPDDRTVYINRLMQEGRIRNHEVKMRRRDGATFWSLLSMNKLDLAGETVAIGSLYDITARRHAEEKQQAALRELRETQAMLVTSEKMAALGNLVAGIAHEINTPVGAMLSTHDTLMRAFARLKPQLRADRPETEPLVRTIQDCNEVIQCGANRVAAIVRRLRSFARLDEAELQEANLEEGLDDTLALLHHQLKHGIEIERDYGSIPPIRCYPGRLNQVFLNLLVNARQAIEGTGKITVRTRKLDGRVSVQIIDSGCGIPPDHIPRLFDPGFTTKGVGVGTGLGLSICFQIIQEHKGEIRVESKVDTGTTFEVLVPEAPG
ncbi:MAG: ATP-binding protein [Myxococcales bacterium]|nr:ATP-binding protein [Myxococcales bacterium]